MQASQIPSKFPIPWANSAGSGYVRTIPEASQIGVQNGAASLTDGFPPNTFIQEAAGGVPPFGQDTNGILKQITQWLQWVGAGGVVLYDAGYSSAIGGYPLGAVLTTAASPTQWWVSTVDNNVTDPDTGGAGWQLVEPVQCYNGNPNGNVAGVAGVSGGQSPTTLWDTVHGLMWVCTTTGTTSTAQWMSIGGGGAYNCGTSAGSANAQVLTPPPAMQSFGAGTQFTFIVGAGLTNTAATTIAITGIGTYSARRPSIGGPVALAGKELAAGNEVLCEYDGTYIQILTVATGTAALQNASSITGTVAGVQGAGSIPVGEIMVAVDANGTIGGSGTLISSLNWTILTVANNGQTIQPGNYLVDLSGGAATLYLSTSVSGAYTFADPTNSWSANNLTLNGNGNPIGKSATQAASTFLADAGDRQFNVIGESSPSVYWRLF